MSEHGEEGVMATTIQHKQARVGTAGEVVPGAVFGHDGQPTAARLTTEQVWHQVAKASFAVLSQVTRAGEPRSSGVVYKTIGRRLYVAVAPDSWKARHTMTASLTDPKIGHSDHEFLGIDELGMKARIAGILNRWPAVGLAVGVVRNGSLEFFHGHGLADIASSTPITEDRVFRIASISKAFTAIAVMQLWEQGPAGPSPPGADGAELDERPATNVSTTGKVR